MATARRALLLCRSVVVTSVTVFLAAAGHAAGGGGTPPGVLLLALAAILLPPVLFLARWKFSFPVLATVLAAGQLLLHAAFSMIPWAAGCDAAGPAAGVDHAAHAGQSGCWPAGPAENQLAEAAGDGGQMTAAHLAAVVLTAVVLARGEDALWHLLALLRPLARIPAPATLPATARSLVTIREADVPPSRTRLRAHRLRGPPALPWSKPIRF